MTDKTKTGGAPPVSSPPGATGTPPAGDLANAAALADAVSLQPEAKEYPEAAYVKTATGASMRHLLTNVEISGRPVKIPIDSFARAQLDAGKWVIEN